MKKEKLLELIKYIKKNDLIQKYNDVYKEYDEKKDIKNPGFKLEDLYSLTDEEIDLILASKHDVEALFRLRMNNVHYKDLIKCDVKTNDVVVLETIEDFRSFEDYEEYDKDKNIIELIIKQDLQGTYKTIYSIIYFLSHMTNKKELADTNLSVDTLFHYLCCISECKAYKSANLIAILASSSKERTDCGFHRYVRNDDYELRVIDKISECNKNFQSDYIGELLRMKVNIPYCNPVLLNNIEVMDKRLKVIELFTKAENEDACKKMLETIQENVEKLRNNPDRIINMLEECTTLKSDEDYVNITAITEIEDLEEILDNMDDGVEIDESVKVKVKKKKK